MTPNPIRSNPVYAKILRSKSIRPQTTRQIRRSLGLLSLFALCFAIATSGLPRFRSCPVQPATSMKAVPVSPPGSLPSASPESYSQADSAGFSTNNNPAELSLLLYNVQFRPRLLFASDQITRAEKLVPLLQGYDAIVLSEAFDDGAIKHLLQALDSTYPHVSQPVGQNQGFSQDSGLVIASRWPIVANSQTQTVFDDDCDGQSCFNVQGVVSLAINKTGRQYQLVTAQFQSGVSPRASTIRAAQVQQTQDFLAALPPNDPVIFAASLPISPERSPQSYEQLAEAIEGTSPESLTPEAYSVDSAQNPLAKPGRQYTPDAFFTLGQHSQPTIATTQIRPLRTKVEHGWTFSPWVYWQCPHQDLSDHYAVEGYFRYDKTVGE